METLAPFLATQLSVLRAEARFIFGIKCLASLLLCPTICTRKILAKKVFSEEDRKSKTHVRYFHVEASPFARLSDS